jgi:hypothetical protein
VASRCSCHPEVMPNIASLEMKNPLAIPALLAFSTPKSPTRFHEDPFPGNVVAGASGGDHVLADFVKGKGGGIDTPCERPDASVHSSISPHARCGGHSRRCATSCRVRPIGREPVVDVFPEHEH